MKLISNSENIEIHLKNIINLQNLNYMTFSVTSYVTQKHTTKILSKYDEKIMTQSINSYSIKSIVKLMNLIIRKWSYYKYHTYKFIFSANGIKNTKRK